MIDEFFMNFAKCRENTEVNFFGENSTATTKAVKFCSDCVVKPACLRYAIENEIQYGVWGGTSQRSRRLMFAK